MKKDFTISLKVYEESKILQAIEEVLWAVDISFSDGVLSISWESENEIEEIFNELMNYVLFL